MAKQLDKDMMRMMSVTERFKYQNDLKRIRLNIDDIKNEADKDEPINGMLNESDWVDRDESDWDSSSDGKSGYGESSSGDDSNEY